MEISLRGSSKKAKRGDICISFTQAEEMAEAVAAELFDDDPRVRSVGITAHKGGYGYRVVRNSSLSVPQALKKPAPGELRGVPVTFVDTPAEVELLVAVPASSSAGFIPEVSGRRPLVSGLQIQNFDDDLRQGVLAQGLMFVGTLGCFVRLSDSRPGFVSNNHVVAGENRGARGKDRILQPGSDAYTLADQVGMLEDFVKILDSPPGATPKQGTAILNEVDAGLVVLDDGVPFTQGFLPSRRLTALSAVAQAQVGDQVFKVGRTTGLTFGEVKDVTTIVGPIAYDHGLCWFRRSFVIEGLNGSLFSDKGDSGAAIVQTNGEVVGLLYAGNGQQSYACLIDTVLTSFGCSLA